MASARCVLPFVTLFALACSGAGEPRPAEQSEPSEPSVPGDPEPPRAIDPDSTCGHAERCCQAFASAMPNVDRAAVCSGVAEAMTSADPDARCRAMIAGWRQALAHLPEADPRECE